MSNAVETQLDLWNGPAGERWVREQERLDRAFVHIDRIALEAAAAASGERIIDIGCGCGGSTLALAERVGPTGAVLGVDISSPMLARATERAVKVPWARFARADAASHPFDGEADLLFSRFGVMFFDEPKAAFAHLRGALRPNGRIAFVVWRAGDANPWLTGPMRAAEKLLPAVPSPPEDGPGPFALAEPSKTRAIFEGAGFQSVELSSHDVDLELSTTGLDGAVDFALGAGPLARRVEAVDAGTVERVRAAVRETFAPFVAGDRVAAPGAVWIVRARA